MLKQSRGGFTEPETTNDIPTRGVWAPYPLERKRSGNKISSLHGWEGARVCVLETAWPNTDELNL